MADVIYHNALTLMGTGAIDFDTDTLKVALLTSSYTPNVDHTQWTDVSTYEISAGNGYIAGGDTVTSTVTDDDTNDQADFDISDPSWTASGGSIGPARYGVLYDDTHASDVLIYLFDFTTDQTANDGADFTISIDTGGLFTMAQA